MKILTIYKRIASVELDNLLESNRKNPEEKRAEYNRHDHPLVCPTSKKDANLLSHFSGQNPGHVMKYSCKFVNTFQDIAALHDVELVFEDGPDISPEEFDKSATAVAEEGAFYIPLPLTINA